jgi:Starch-binding associating with outer membrane
MKKINLFLLLIFSIVTLSCDDYLDVNQNENRVLLQDQTPEDLLSAAQSDTYREQAQTMNRLGNIFTNAWSGNNLTFASPLFDEYTMNINVNFYSRIWDLQFRRIANFETIAKKPNPGGVNDNFIAAAQICKVHYMQYLVDLYGDVPYNEAFKYTANLTPKYNDDQFIYRKLIGELESAKALIIAANPNATDITPYDVMLGGVMSDWYAFANTIELRMLLRMSNSTGAVAAYRDAKLVTLNNDVTTGPAGYITASVKVNPGYNTKNDESLSPYYGYVERDATGTTVALRPFLVPSGHALKSLSLYSLYVPNSPAPFPAGTSSGNSTTVIGTQLYPNVSDPRRTRIFSNGVAATQGSTVVDVLIASTPGAFGRVGGLGLLNPYNAVSPLTVFTDLVGVNNYVMTLAEAKFLQAEAGLRGYTGFSAASSVADYNAGIDDSMNYLTVTPAANTAYKTAISNKIGYSMTAAGSTPAQKLQGLMYQKWVSLIGIHGIESYIDYTRTGYPIAPLPIGNVKPNRPLRLNYPNSEYVANSANVPSVSDAEIFTLNAKSPFWLQGNPPLGN